MSKRSEKFPDLLKCHFRYFADSTLGIVPINSHRYADIGGQSTYRFPTIHRLSPHFTTFTAS